MTAMIDLFKLSEDDRITYIVDAIRTGMRIPLLLEDDKLAPGKIERYVRKVKERLPGVSVEITNGPVANVRMVTFVQGQ